MWQVAYRRCIMALHVKYLGQLLQGPLDLTPVPSLISERVTIESRAIC